MPSQADDHSPPLLAASAASVEPEGRFLFVLSPPNQWRCLGWLRMTGAELDLNFEEK